LGLSSVNHFFLVGKNPEPCKKNVFQTHGFVFELAIDHVHCW